MCKEYELAGIETIARGICIQDKCVLLCRAKGSETTYLPGGHIEFGEKGCEALVREIKEEMGLDATVKYFITAVENSFVQHGKPHAEINMVYFFTLPPNSPAKSCEDWITFEWYPIEDIEGANLLPEEMIPLVKEYL